MATPHVAALAALTLSANHSLTATQLRSLIVEGADHSISGSDSNGGINAALTVALAAAGQTTSSSTVSTSAVQASTQTVVSRWFVRSTAERSEAAAPSTVASFTLPTAPVATAVAAASFDQGPFSDSPHTVALDAALEAWDLADNTDDDTLASLASDMLDELACDAELSESLLGTADLASGNLLGLLSYQAADCYHIVV